MSFLKDYLYPRVGPLTSDQSKLLYQVSALVDSAAVGVQEAKSVVDEFILSGKIDETSVRRLPAVASDWLKSQPQAQTYRVGVLWQKPSPIMLANQGETSLATPKANFLKDKPHWSAIEILNEHHNSEEYEEFFLRVLNLGEVLERLADLVTQSGEALHKQTFAKLAGMQARTVEETESLSEYPDDKYLKDLNDRLSLLEGRVWDLGLEIGEELDKKEGRVSLFDVVTPRRFTAKKKPKSSGPQIPRPQKTKGNKFEALKSKLQAPLGIKFMAHQIEALKAIERDKSLAKRLGDKGRYESTIVMPTGSGKTKIMMGAIAMDVLSKDFKEGDKYVLTSHLKNITKQNIETAKRELEAVFQKKLGRSVRVSVVAGDVEDYSGDIVLMSIPKVGRSDYELETKLKAPQLNGRVRMLLMDEVHHGEAASWKRVEAAVKSQNPQAYLLGMTATPNGHEAHIIYKRKPLKMFQLGVLPKILVYEMKTGIRLDGIKQLKKDFDQRELESTLNVPERNKKILEALNEVGFRQVNNTRQLAPTLITVVDKQHGIDLAKIYVEYFKDGSEGLMRRRIAFAGTHQEVKNGKTHYRGWSEKEIEEVLGKKRKGEIDAIVAVVTGDMSDKAEAKVIEAWKAGEIEAVISAKKYGEGLDGWWIQNLVGGKATLSNTEKTQEAGRLIRRNKDEVNWDNGEIIKEVPRIAIDIVDDLVSHERYLKRYREAYGFNQLIPNQTVWDMIENKAVGAAKLQPDNSTENKPAPTENPNDDEEIKTQIPKGIWHKLIEQLCEILTKVYENNSEEMSYDLGLEEDELLGILIGEIPLEGKIDLVKRMATLLYLDRSSFTGALMRDLGQTDGQAVYRAMEALKMGLEYYLSRERVGDAKGGVKIQVRGEVKKISSSFMKHLYAGRFQSRLFKQIAQGVGEYLKIKGELSLRSQLIESMNEVYDGRLLWDKRLEVIVDETGDLQGLMRATGLNPKAIEDLLTQKIIYLVGSNESTIGSDGSLWGSLDFDLGEPEKNAEGGPSKKPYVVFKQKEGQWWLEESGGNNNRLLVQALEDGGFIRVSERYRWIRLKNLQKISGLGKETLNRLWKEVCSKELFPKVYLVGASKSFILPDGSLQGSFSVELNKPPKGLDDKSRGVPYVELIREGDQWWLGESGGKHNMLLVRALEAAGLVEVKEVTRWSRLEGVEEISKLGPDALSRVLKECYPTDMPSKVYLVTSGPSNIFGDGSIVGTLSFALERPEKNDGRHFSKTYVALIQKAGRWWVDESGGTNAKLLKHALVKAGLAIDKVGNVFSGIDTQLEVPLKLADNGPLPESHLANRAAQLMQALSNAGDSAKAAAWVHKGLMATHWLQAAEIDSTELTTIVPADISIEADSLNEMAKPPEDHLVLSPLTDLNLLGVMAPTWGLQLQMGFVH